jgi:hypothetical protein
MMHGYFGFLDAEEHDVKRHAVAAIAAILFTAVLAPGFAVAALPGHSKDVNRSWHAYGRDSATRCEKMALTCAFALS